MCLLVDAEAPYYELDFDFAAKDFQQFEKTGFKEAPFPASQSISRYLSVAKSAMDYRPGKGDKIFIFLCPRSQWDDLKLTWPSNKR